MSAKNTVTLGRFLISSEASLYMLSLLFFFVVVFVGGDLTAWWSLWGLSSLTRDSIGPPEISPIYILPFV